MFSQHRKLSKWWGMHMILSISLGVPDNYCCCVLTPPGLFPRARGEGAGAEGGLGAAGQLLLGR